MKNLILMCCAFMGTLYSRAATETVDGITWNYTVSGKISRIHGDAYYNRPTISSSTSGSIKVPSLLGGYPVTSIGVCSFKNCRFLTDVFIPEGVTYIDQEAFRGCASLLSLTIPASVTGIGSDAFVGCTNVVDVVVPGWTCGIPFSSVTNLVIAYGTVRISNFSNCDSLVSVTIPDSVMDINDSTFSGCSALKNVVIPNSITNIGGSAFSGCSSLGDITIPSGVTKIGSSAFSWCSSLTNAVVLGTGLYHEPLNGENSSYSPFRNCSNLVSVTTMDTCAYMFKGCNKVKEIILLDGVRQIKNCAFYNCKCMTEIEIPNSVTKIEEKSFYCCSSLKRVTMSDRVKSIGSSAFYGCSSIADINRLPQCVCTGKVSKVFPSCQSITNIVVADGVTRIGVECFNECLGLKRIVIPASVTVIYDNAFKNCSALEEIVFLGDAPDVGSDILLGTPRSLKITVKEGSVGWKGGVSTELPEAWPIGDATARGIVYSGSVVPPESGSSPGGGTVSGLDTRYDLGDTVQDRMISSVEIDGDAAIDEFVLKDGKVFDCAVRIVNKSEQAAKVSLPRGYIYEKFRGTKPLLIPAASTNLLTITRIKENTFLLSREQLVTEIVE